MTIVKHWIAIIIALCFAPIGSLQAFYGNFYDFETEIETGVRWDRIDEMVEIVDTTMVLPYDSIYKQLKTMVTYVAGGRGYIDYCNWIVKGAGHYGWTISGDFDEDHIFTSSIRGNTVDGLAGFGYALPVTNCFWVAPMIGYSYDQLHLRVNEARSINPILFPPNIKQAHFTSSWYGPWVGFDILFEGCFRRCYYFSYCAGYEFHYGWARTHWNQELFTPPEGFLEYQTRLNSAMGHVFRFDAQFHMDKEWLVGLGLQFTQWANSHKNRSHFTPGSITGLSPTQVQDTFKLNWQSFAIFLNLTRTF